MFGYIVRRDHIMSNLRYQMVKLLVAVVIMLLTINIALIMYIQRPSRETTLIIQDIHNRAKSSEFSSSDEILRIGNKPYTLKQHGEVQVIQNISSNGEETDEERRPLPDERGQSNRAGEDSYWIPMQDDAVDTLIKKLRAENKFFPVDFWTSSLAKLTRQLGALTRTKAIHLAGYEKIRARSEKLPNWKIVHRHIQRYSLYDPDDEAVQGLLDDMRTLPIKEADDNQGGTQLKMVFRFSDGGRAMFKPMRYSREVETSPNHYIFDDIERHYAEIAAFHLDRLLGFYRIPPVVGRKFNLTSEIKPLAPKPIKKTFFTSPAGNICFYGECDYYCDSAHPICGNPDIIEGALMSYLPSRNIADRHSWYQPWRRSYSKFRKAEWEKHEDFCRNIIHDTPYNNGKLLQDMIDTHTFDFLTGNKDRHSFCTFSEFGNYTFPILYDNGRGFGFKEYDAMSILAPLRQCCLIRKSTFLKYVKLYTGPERLSSLMEESMASDLVAPVLLPGHLRSLDRRLIKILKTVAECIIDKGRPYSDVIKSDRF